MKRIFKVSATIVSVVMLGLLAILLCLQIMLPDRYYVTQGEHFSLNGGWLGIKSSSWVDNMPPELVSRPGNEYAMRLSLPGGAVIKTVNVKVVERDMVIPAGTPFGIKMFTDGVMVVGLSDLDLQGKAMNPAKNAGIRTGDIILSIDGRKIYYNEDVGKIVSQSNGREMQVTLRRDGNIKQVNLKPIQSPSDESYRAGMWVRDSSAGIGTMTYYDPQERIFAGLGHAICDVDTGDIMPLSSGEAVEVTITGVNRGSSGFPGELRGVFGSNKVIGSLIKNNVTGIYGECSMPPVQCEPVPLATRGEIHTGAATIYTTVEGKQPQAYDIQIERIATTDTNPTKNMVVKVTDPRLLEVTGGIVQGMSGSPIIQDGKLVGAITHVFVNDPARGYGIFAENMRNSYSTGEKMAS
ncbi:SpoIVB peptidase [Oscillospiraceae bacterium LTW-04]|nr:SpoIVB peptidase [Oscillospiraceae bacterium MB24-C1]